MAAIFRSSPIRPRALGFALLASTALVGVASPAFAQVTLATPAGGGTITAPDATGTMVNDQTSLSGGITLNLAAGALPTSFTGVTVTNSSAAPGSDAIALTDAGNAIQGQFYGAQNLTSLINGGAALSAIGNDAVSLDFYSAGGQFTGSIGINAQAAGNVSIDMNGNAQTFTANGAALVGARGVSTGGDATIDLANSTVSGFQSGIAVSAAANASATTTGGSISAANTAITASGSSATVNSQSAINAPDGISATSNGGNVTITTSGAGTIDGSSVGIRATVSSGAGSVNVTVGAAIGGTTTPSTGVVAKNSGTGVVNVTTTAAIKATGDAISLSAPFTGVGTISIGADVTGGRGIYANSGYYNMTIATGATVTGTSNAGFAGGIATSADGQTITNNGSIIYTGTSSFGGGIFNGGNNTTTNNAGASITGSIGIYDLNSATVVNAGTITGTVGAATKMFGGTLTNSGSLSGSTDGVSNTANVLTVSNSGSGTITGANNGINLTDAFAGAFNRLLLTNVGWIEGTAQAGVHLATSGNGASQIDNSGAIVGGSDATHGFGVDVDDGTVTINNVAGGSIAGGTGAIRFASNDSAVLNVGAGSLVNGQILSTNSGARTVNVTGSLGGGYNASSGTGTNNFTLASIGSMQGATFGSGNDSFTYQGGLIGGTVDGGAGTDSFASVLGAGNSASLSLTALSNFESYAQSSGTLTLTGSQAGGPGWNVGSGAALRVDGALTGVAGNAIYAQPNSAITVDATGAVAGGTGVNFNGGPSSLTNVGAISGTLNAVYSTGQLTAANSGTISGGTGIFFNGGPSSLTNSGSISGTSNAVYSSAQLTTTNSGSISGGSATYNYGAYAAGANSSLDNQAGGTIGGARAIAFGGANANLHNAGTINSTAAVAGDGYGAIMFAGGSTTNDLGGLIQASSAGLLVQGGAGILSNAGTISGGGWGAILTGTTGVSSVVNSGSMSGGTYNAVYLGGSSGNSVLNSGTMIGGNAAIYSDGANLSVVNSGLIRIVGGTANTVTSGIYTSMAGASVTNTGAIDSTLATGTGVKLDAGGTITNSSAISGGTSGGAAGVNLGASGTITNQLGGQIGGYDAIVSRGGTLTLNNAGTVQNSGGNAISASGAGLSIDNSGLIDGFVSTANGTSLSIVNRAGATIRSTATAGDLMYPVSSVVSILNAGTISTDGFSATGVEGNGSAVITNATGGILQGGNDTTYGQFGNAVQFGGASLTFNNYGTALSQGGQAAVYGTSGGSATVNLFAGSSTGDISLGYGDDTLAIYSGRGTAGGATVDGATGITLQNAGTLAAASFGAINLGGGNDTLQLRGTGDDTAANGAASSFNALGLVNVTTIQKLDSGTWTLSGAAASGGAAIIAGDGGNNDGLLVFDNTSGLTGAIVVNGAIIRANSAGAFGTGTITMIDPTIQYAASGTYSNDIVLAVPGDASLDPNILQTMNNAVATLTGSITQDPSVGPQYVEIAGDGQIVLTNAANSWAGTTTIDGGAVLTGTSASISGGSIVDNGTLNYNQPLSGTVGQAINGGGVVNVSGLNAGETLTLAGGSNLSGGFNVLDGSAVALGGINGGAGTGIALLADNASATILAGAQLSAGSYGVAAYGAGDSVDNQGAISSGYVGVSFVNAAATITNGSATNAAASITGFYTGSSNNAAATVDNYGTITGTWFNGLDGNGPITLTNHAGAIVEGAGGYGPGNGIGVLGGSSVTIVNDGAVLGRFAGVLSNGTIDVTNRGLIGSGSLDGLGNFVYSDGNDGINARGGGTVDNQAGGRILGAISGIYAINASLAVTNAGDIDGNQYGIYGDAVIGLTNAAGGTVSGGTTGLQLSVDGNTIDNAGTISGGTVGIRHGSFTLTNAGTISGGGNAAILTQTSAASSIDNSGTITGGTASVGGGNLTITNQAGGSFLRVPFGSAIDMSNGGMLTLVNAGDIVGSGWGVVGRNAGDSIVNSGRIASGTISGGTITASGANAIELQQGGTVTNLSGGQVIGNANAIIGGNMIVDNRAGASISGVTGVQMSAGTVTNGGSIQGGANAFNRGVYVTGAGSVTNLAGGTITAARGVQMSGAGAVVTNSGTINGTATSSANAIGVSLFAGGSVTNDVGGVINSGGQGILSQGGVGTVVNRGTVDAGSFAIIVFGGGTIDNYGSVIAGATGNALTLTGNGTVTNHAGGTLTAVDASDAWGILGQTGVQTLVNDGSINAGSGILSSTTGSKIINTGTVNAQVNGAWALTGAIDLANSGTITASGDAGVMTGAGGTILNSGAITGGSSAADGFGIVIAGGNASVTNQAGGTINGGTGAILLSGSGTIALDLQAGSTTTGFVASTAAATATVTIAGALNGQYDASTGTGIDSLIVASTGSLGGASLGASADSFTTRGGGIANLVDGGADSDALTFDIAGTASYDAGLFAGFESRTKTGAGTLTLTGTDAQTTDFAVAQGTLALSGGAAMNDAAAVSVAGGATLQLDSSEAIRTLTGAGNVTLGANALFLVGDDSVAFDGVISGSGSLAKFGTGTFTLTGANAYTGITQVSGGTLALGAMGVIADTSVVLVQAPATFDLAGFNETVGGLAGDGAIQLGSATLTLDQSVDTLFSGSVAGSGGLTKDGAGTLYLTGTSGYTGATTVNGGLLEVDGTLASVVTVNSGAALTGNGTVGGLVVASGGTFNAGMVNPVPAPASGLSPMLVPPGTIGHMIVAGDLTFAGGSIYQVDVTPTAADETSATGNIVIAGGTVDVRATGTAYNPLSRYLILDAGGSVSGTFASVTSDLAFLDPSLEYTPNTVVLALRRNDIVFSDVAANPNQAGVADAVQSIGSGPLYDAVLVQSAGGARQAFNALSGEVYASTPVALADAGDRLPEAMRHAGAALRPGFGAWADGKVGTTDFDGSASIGNAGASVHHQDVMGGLAWSGGTVNATVGVGTIEVKNRVGDRASNAKATGTMAGGQFGLASGRLHGAVGASASWFNVDTDRSIVFPGFAEQTSSSQDARGHVVYGEVAFDAARWQALGLQAFANVARRHVSVDGVGETGGNAALSVDRVKLDTTATQLGVRIGGDQFANAGDWLTPRATIAWQHLSGDRRGAMTAAFDGSDPFTVRGIADPKDALLLDIGADARIGAARLGLSYSGKVASHYDDHSVRATLGFRF